MEIFTFCEIKEEADTDTFLEEILDIPESYWHYDQFRNCYILPLWNPGGQSEKVNQNIVDDFKFTEQAFMCPSLISWVKPTLEKLNGRLTVLKTIPGHKMNIHLDSKESEIGTEQYKWRMVLMGDVNGLYFIDENNKKVYPNNGSKLYILDGTHPHAIEESDEYKITVCIGSPWRGEPMVDNLGEKVKVSRPSIRKEWTL